MEFLITRRNADGSFDNTFDNDGVAEIDSAGSSHTGLSVAMAPDGRILCGGFTYLDGVSLAAVLRFNPETLSSGNFRNETFSVYPNPFTSTINLHDDGIETGNLLVDLFDANGRKVMNLSPATGFDANSIQLQMPETLSKGVYFLKIFDGKMTNSIKIVK